MNRFFVIIPSIIIITITPIFAIYHYELVNDYDILLDDYNVLLDDYNVLLDDYNVLLDDYNVTINKYDVLIADYDNLSHNNDALSSKYDGLFDNHTDLRDNYDQLRDNNDALSYDYNVLIADYEELLDQNNALIDDYNMLLDDTNILVDDNDLLLDDYNILVDDYNILVDDYNSQYPLTTISETEVTAEFYDSKGNYYNWSIPISAYEDTIQYSREYSTYQTYDDPYLLDVNGHTARVLNLDGFVEKAFVDVIDDVYNNSYDDSDFIYEVWYIVSQMTVYDEDVREDSEGRFALETFTRTGGDCEDLVILVADMLISSSHTRNWDFQYVIIDSNNPLNPQDVNHVILYVNDGQYDYFIEATASPDWGYYPNGVDGWWFDVV